jgi:hypothetical protein
VIAAVSEPIRGAIRQKSADVGRSGATATLVDKNEKEFLSDFKLRYYCQIIVAVYTFA